MTNEKCPDDALTHSRCTQTTSIWASNRFQAPGHFGQLARTGCFDTFQWDAGVTALWNGAHLFAVMKYILATWRLHYFGFVGFCIVAESTTISQSLRHF
jgi:hypothetical protein